MTPVTSQTPTEPSPLPVVAETINSSHLHADASTDLSVLMAEIARGNKSALSALYTCTVTQTYSLALRVVRSKECAQEIVCDAFIFIWQNAHTYDVARGSVGAWLATITRNRAIDRVRRNALYRFTSEQLANVPLTARSARSEELQSNFQNGSTVYAALARLSSLRQNLLSLAFFEGLTHKEIAIRAGLPLGTVKSHLRRSLRLLRDAIDKKVGGALSATPT